MARARRAVSRATLYPGPAAFLAGEHVARLEAARADVVAEIGRELEVAGHLRPVVYLAWHVPTLDLVLAHQSHPHQPYHMDTLDKPFRLDNADKA